MGILSGKTKEIFKIHQADAIEQSSSSRTDGQRSPNINENGPPKDDVPEDVKSIVRNCERDVIRPTKRLQMLEIGRSYFGEKMDIRDNTIEHKHGG